MYFYTSYCNYEAINHQLLKKIICQIKRHLKLDDEDDPPKASWSSPVKSMDGHSNTGCYVRLYCYHLLLQLSRPYQSVIIPTQHLPGFTNESEILPAHIGIYQSPGHSEVGRPDVDDVEIV